MTARAPERLLLRIEEAAELCGISRSHAYQLISQGVWPVVRAGASARIPRSWLEAWIRRQIEQWERAACGDEDNKQKACSGVRGRWEA